MVLIDILALLASLGVKLIGFPAQLRARTGMAWQLSAGMCLSYLIWVVQGSLAGDWTLAASQAVGVVLTAALLMQSRKT